MFCPKCSQVLAADEVQFCSRCGIALAGLKEIVAGERPTQTAKGKKQKAEGRKQDSKRLRGIKQGAFLMLLSVILIPAYFLLAALFPANDRLVESAVSDTPFEKISQAVLLTLFLVGLLRAAYAWFFQKEARPELGGQAAPAELPAATAIPVSGFGAWQTNSGELANHKVSNE
jgi:hypothetical protein